MSKLFFLLSALLLCSISNAATVNLAWTFDTSATATCADGATPAAANCPVTGFEIQEQDANGIWNVREGVGATVRTRQYTNVAVGTRKCFRLRTNSNGTFSVPSNEACIVVPSLPPKAPSGITVTVSVAIEPTP